jgi:membrane protease YdiL (CAAX protease family)
LSLFPLAWAFGAIAPEFSLPQWWWIFALNNLLFTCVAEEALFRGLIQQYLVGKFGSMAGITLAALLFGMAHFSGGLLLIFFSGLAGLGYGLIFYWTGRLWFAIGVHFLFNFGHFIFFTYPLLNSPL